jgi:hypothetical protein
MWTSVQHKLVVQAACDVQQLDLSKQDFLGRAEFELAQVVQAMPAPTQWALKNGSGCVTVAAGEVVDFKKSLRLTVRCVLTHSRSTSSAL